MNFTDDMIREVLFALQHPGARAKHAENGSIGITALAEQAEEVPDDGFMDALKARASEIWTEDDLPGGDADEGSAK